MDSLTLVLAGGAGKRLRPLTIDRAKPAVPFGGSHRVIDFFLSSAVHSGLRKIRVLTQFESDSLIDHITDGWGYRFGTGSDEYLKTLAASQRDDSGWYKGTADAVYQSRKHIFRENAELDPRFIINVFGGDHIYRMDISQMHYHHNRNKAAMTIAAMPVRRELAAGNYGVLEVDKKNRIIGFEEKPADPKPIPGRENYCLTSMGNYSFDTKALLEALARDADKETVTKAERQNTKTQTTHDFGYDVIPDMLERGLHLLAYDFSKNRMAPAENSTEPYWRDIGNIDQFYQANMELVDIQPPLNLYDKKWQIYTHSRNQVLGKINWGSDVSELLLGNGAIIDGGYVRKAIIGMGSKVEREARVEEGILLGYNKIGRGAKVGKAILDKGASIPVGERVGYDRTEDEANGYHFDEESGITVVPVVRNHQF